MASGCEKPRAVDIPLFDYFIFPRPTKRLRARDTRMGMASSDGMGTGSGMWVGVIMLLSSCWTVLG